MVGAADSRTEMRRGRNVWRGAVGTRLDYGWAASNLRRAFEEPRPHLSLEPQPGQPQPLKPQFPEACVRKALANHPILHKIGPSLAPLQAAVNYFAKMRGGDKPAIRPAPGARKIRRREPSPVGGAPGFGAPSCDRGREIGRPPNESGDGGGSGREIRIWASI